MSGLNKLMGRGILPPLVHGVLDYPLAAVLIVLPLVRSFDDNAAKWIAFAFGIGAAVLAVGTAWPTSVVKIIPPILHGYADIAVTVALIVLPFIVAFSDHTTALVFYLVVGAAGLAATLVTRFEPLKAAEQEQEMNLRMAA
jgi:predicted cation transporter